jgi:hypothetical protein
MLTNGSMKRDARRLRPVGLFTLAALGLAATCATAAACSATEPSEPTDAGAPDDVRGADADDAPVVDAADHALDASAAADGDRDDGGPSGDAGPDGAIVPPRTVGGATQRYPLIGMPMDKVATLGKLWGGYMSFTASTFSPISTDVPAEIIDGFGNTFTVIETTSSVLVKLPTPITVRVVQGNGNIQQIALTLNDVVFELSSLTTPAAPLTGKADTADPLPAVYDDLVGVPLSVTLDATFFANFTSNACANVVVLSNGAQVGALTAAAPKATLAVTAPLGFRVAPTCQTSRLPAPQNAATDFSIQVTHVALP